MQKLRVVQWLAICALMGCNVASKPASKPSTEAPGAVTFDDAPLAFEAYGQGRYADAARLFLQYPRQDSVMRLLSAQAQLETCTTTSELDAVFRRAQLEPLDADQSPQAHFVMAYIALRTNHLDVAAAENERSLELYPFGEVAGAALNNIGQVHYLREQFDLAREKTELALQQASQHGRGIARTNLAEFDALEGHLDAAEARLNEMPLHPAALFELARVYDVTGRTEGALALEREALSRDPAHLIRHNMTFVWPELRLQNEALEAEATGDWTSATSAWTALHSRECDGLRWEALKGVAEEHLRRLGAAIAVCTPVEPAPSVAVAVVAAPVRVGVSPESAPTAPVAHPGIAAVPTSNRTTTAPAFSKRELVDHKQRGMTALFGNRLDEAADEFRAVLALDSRDMVGHEGMGMVRYMQGDFSGARTELENALDVADEQHSVATLLASLGDIDAINGDLSRAEQKINEAVKADPESPLPYYEMAVIYDVLGRDSDSMAMERRALALDPQRNASATSLFVWPELKLQFDALAAEASGETKAAIAGWTALKLIDEKGALRWSVLHGRAAAHLAHLGLE